MGGEGGRGGVWPFCKLWVERNKHEHEYEVMLILILIDVQYSKKAVFSFENRLNGQNHSSGSHYLVKKIPAKFPILPPSFTTIWKNLVIHKNITFSHNFSQHIQISCLKNQYGKNQIICFTAPITVALQRDEVKVSHTKINHIFSCNKSASAELHNYPINLFLSVNKNLVNFWHIIFFLDVSHCIL